MNGRIKIALCGACLSGNMGGPAMYISMVETLKRLFGHVEVTVLSKYPQDDQEPAKSLGWKLVSFPTTKQMIYGIPFWLLTSLLRWLHIPYNWLAVGPLAAYLQNDLLIDFSGISFSDDRPFSGLIINSLWLLPAVGAGIPWMKASQAMGPFDKPLVRITAKYILSKAKALVARGEESERLVRQLLPASMVYQFPDVAFLLGKASDQETDRALDTAGLPPAAGYCVVNPSQLVDSMMAAKKGPGTYARIMAKTCDYLVELSGGPVLLLPHARATIYESSDDLVVAQEIYQFCENRAKVYILQEKVSASILKGIVSKAEIAVGSRFHFMIAAMSSCVPGLAITWGHKYREMMKMVGQERFALANEQLNESELLDSIKELWVSREEIHKQLDQNVPAIIRQAEQNAILALNILKIGNANSNPRVNANPAKNA